MTEQRQPLTTETVWLFMSEGCNQREIAAFAHISEQAAEAWMLHASRKFARGAA